VAESLGIRSNAALEESFAWSLPTWPAFDDTTPCLTWLAGRYRLGIISNVDDDLLGQTLKQLPVPIDVTVTSEQTKSYKPNRTIFEAAVEQIGEPAANIVHIAEGRCEAVPARADGMRSIWVERSPRSDDGSQAQPDAVVSNLRQLVDAIS
jgi:2-haloacid dehalogenase